MEIYKDLQSLITSELEWEGVELVDLKLKGRPGNYTLCVVADKDSGISIDECADISRRLVLIRELDDLLGSNYKLEVSSPGLDRPLTREAEFRTKIGRSLKIIYSDEEVKKVVKGKLFDVLPDGIYIEVEGKQKFIQYPRIINAVQALPW